MIEKCRSKIKINGIPFRSHTQCLLIVQCSIKIKGVYYILHNLILRRKKHSSIRFFPCILGVLNLYLQDDLKEQKKIDYLFPDALIVVAQDELDASKIINAIDLKFVLLKSFSENLLLVMLTFSALFSVMRLD